MGIEISSKLLNKIVDDHFKQNAEEMLRQKSRGKCFLCEQILDFENDRIVADHDIPEADNGPTDYDNLNLVHWTCNAFKNKNSTLKIKRFLPLKQFLSVNHGANFEKVSEVLFGVTKKELYLEIEGDLVFFKDPNLNDRLGPYKILTERIQAANNEIRYIFTRLPIRYLYNDSVQPRAIKEDQVFKLFQDLHINPLHEPVGARLSVPMSELTSGGPWSTKILMFDGQHKTVAKALFEVAGGDYGSAEVDVKIYLDFTQDNANQLVNSIQALIIKLALTKSEFANKMGEEFKPKFEEYEQRCRLNNQLPTESNFVKTAPAEDRARIKKALIQARLKQLLNDPDGNEINIMKLRNIEDRGLRLQETTLFNKVLQRLIVTKPLDDVIDANDTTRSRERINVQIVLDLLYDELLNVSASVPKEIASQMLTQSVLSYLVDLTKAYIHWLYQNANANTIFFHDNFEDVVKENLRKFYREFRKHPIWGYHNNYQNILKVERFFNAIQQNQSLGDFAEKVCLHQPYCVKMPPFTSGVTVDCLKDPH